MLDQMHQVKETRGNAPNVTTRPMSEAMYCTMTIVTILPQPIGSIAKECKNSSHAQSLPRDSSHRPQERRGPDTAKNQLPLHVSNDAEQRTQT